MAAPCIITESDKIKREFVRANTTDSLIATELESDEIMMEFVSIAMI